MICDKNVSIRAHIHDMFVSAPYYCVNELVLYANQSETTTTARGTQ